MSPRGKGRFKEKEQSKELSCTGQLGSHQTFAPTRSYTHHLFWHVVHSFTSTFVYEHPRVGVHGMIKSIGDRPVKH